jgi:hypothetical protein
MWADQLVPSNGHAPTPSPLRVRVRRDVRWIAAAAVLGGAYIAVLGPGLAFPH